jgi:hypothetical protein
MTRRAWIPLLFLGASILVSWWLSRAQARTLNVVATQFSLPNLPDTFVFNNTDRVRAVRGKLAKPATLRPCTVTRAESNTDAATEDPRTESCELAIEPPRSSFELIAPPGTAPFRQVSISGKRDGCSATVRADSSTAGQLAIAWFPTGAVCSPVVGIQIEEKTPLQARGLTEGGKLADRLGGAELAALQMGVPRDEPVAFELEASSAGEELELWNSDRRLESLVLVPAASFTIEHGAGLDTIHRSCEAARGGRVSIGGPGHPITLHRVGLVREGVEVSFSLEGAWKIDTGVCELSNRRLEWIAFTLQLAGLLGALGFFAWFTERRWF